MLEEYFHGENRNKPHDTRSAAKSLTSALVGAAIHAGVPLDVSAPVYKVMNGGEVPGGLDPRKANLRLEHLLTMSSGLDCDDGDPKSPGYEDFMLGQHAQPDFYQFMLALNMLRVLVGRSSSFEPVFIWGPVGVGKSYVVRQLAEALKLQLQDVSALLLDPVDLRGLPFLGSDGCSKRATPEFLLQEGAGILFLDELNAAPAMVQASCYQLVLNLKLGEYTLPEGWAIIVASKRDSDRAVTTRMQPLAEPFRAPGIRGRRPGMVRVGD